jgi:glycosyltransferase 2 family protein
VKVRGLTVGVKLGFLVVVVALGVLVVIRRRDELADAMERISWMAVLAAVPLAALAQLAAVGSYRIVLRDLGAPLPVPAASRLYFVSQLGKYLPGTVWVMVAMVAMSQEYRIPRRTSFAAFVLSLAFSIGTALCIAAVLLPLAMADTARHLWYVWLLIPVFLIGLHPRVFGAVLDRALVLARRAPLPHRMTYAGTMRAVLWQSLSWLLFGLHAWVLMIGIGAPVASSLAVSVGGFALAYGCGPLFVVAPAGAGVREAGLVLTLGPVVGAAGALVVALISRAALVFVDFAQAGVWTVIARRARQAPGATPSQSPQQREIGSRVTSSYFLPKR